MLRGLLCGMWSVILYVVCCMVSGLLYGMSTAGYKGCSVCGLLNGTWAVVGFVGCRMVCGLL